VIKEKARSTVSGLLALFLLLVILGLAIYGLVSGIRAPGLTAKLVGIIGSALVMAADLISLAGLFVVNPNQGVVVQLFGRYTGTARDPGLHWVNPFTTRSAISLRVRNFETGQLKVNDQDGNPIEIAAVVVWKVVDTAEASFEVDHYEDYVHVQSEAALRNLATAYPYDSHKENQTSLRGHTSIVATHLQEEIHARLAKAGVEVLEARISHLAYAPEIAAVMLQRQQATAIIAARQKIVEGAVGRVEMALDMLSQKEVVTLDDERWAAMVSNLLVVLCGERGTQPVVNTGTIYQ